MAGDADAEREANDIVRLREDMFSVLDRVESLVAAGGADAPAAERIGNFVIDRLGHRVMVDGEEVPLAYKEFALLSYLVANSGRMVTYAELLEKIWGTSQVDRKKSLHVHIRWLREKLEGRTPLRIVTINLGGYRLDRLETPPPSEAGGLPA